MQLRSAQRLGVAIGLGLLLACDATAPALERSLRVQGTMLEGGEAPLVPLAVSVQAWVAGLSPISVALETNELGQYAVTLGPTLAMVVDSISVQVTEVSCQGSARTAFTQRRLDASLGDTLVLPSLSLTLPWTPAQASQGGASCAGMEVGDLHDFLRLALWHDDLGPLPHGRWRLNHTASVGDDYGLFDGARTGAGFELVLHSATGCGSFAVSIPVGGLNGSTFGAADLTYTGPCHAPPHLRARFFNGAVLTPPP